MTLSEDKSSIQELLGLPKVGWRQASPRSRVLTRAGMVSPVVIS